MWSERKAISQQVYFEWLPIRETVPGDFDRIYRSFTAGDLLQLTMLDTRLQRDQPPADFPPLCEPSLTDPDREIRRKLRFPAGWPMVRQSACRRTCQEST